MPTVAKSLHTKATIHSSMKTSDSAMPGLPNAIHTDNLGVSKQASNKPLLFNAAFNRMSFLTRGNFVLAAKQTHIQQRSARVCVCFRVRVCAMRTRCSCTFICQSIDVFYECYCIFPKCTGGISYCIQLVHPPESI